MAVLIALFLSLSVIAQCSLAQPKCTQQIQKVSYDVGALIEESAKLLGLQQTIMGELQAVKKDTKLIKIKMNKDCIKG